jgi:hypothetical protein
MTSMTMKIIVLTRAHAFFDDLQDILQKIDDLELHHIHTKIDDILMLVELRDSPKRRRTEASTITIA